MSDIFSTFYHRLLPLFQPRTEAYLHRITPSDLQRSNFRYIFSVQNMIEISYLIEDAVTRSPGTSDTHVSFQYFSRLTPQIDRYKRVAEASRGLWLYGIDDTQLPELPNTTSVITTATPLERYWFVVAYGPGIYMTLLAEEISGDGEDRTYEGFYTFEPEAAFQIVSVLHQMFPTQIPTPISPQEHGKVTT